MPLKRMLIANRGEIAIRIARTAAVMGIPTVGVFSEDDAPSLHVRRVDDARPLRGSGPSAYLDTRRILEIAREAGCDAIHPGYGFLSESGAFARQCAEAGLVFIGPPPEVLDLLGDKAAARAFADRLGVPVLPGTTRATTLEEARAFFTSLGGAAPMMIKAAAAGGGRGMREVRDASALEEAFSRCESEARAFGDPALYVEASLPGAHHVEVQIVADGKRAVHLFERDCSVQRRYQKLIEVAPSPWISPATRSAITSAALRMAAEAAYRGIGTFEFLVDSSFGGDAACYFIEANPRLQVEHTVTEEVLGIDLVRLQIELASGETIEGLGLRQEELAPHGYAIQARVNAETMMPDGTSRSAPGAITVFELPSGAGIRVDTQARAGYASATRFDPLLAKVIVRSPTSNFTDAVALARRALSELRVEGVSTNAALLAAVLAHADFVSGRAHTRFVEEHAGELTSAAGSIAHADSRPAARAGLAGARIDVVDPLAVLEHGKSSGVNTAGQGRPASDPASATADRVPAGLTAVRAPMQGTIIAVEVAPGALIRAGQRLFVMEAMKMEHDVVAPASGIVRHVLVVEGDTVYEDHVLAHLEPADVAVDASLDEQTVDLDAIRPDLAEALERHAIGRDERRADAVAARRKTGQRTARENIEDLCDPGTFVEYGPLVIAAQRRRRPVQELIERTPADGLVAGIGTVNADLFGEEAARCIAMSYDYTVLAGTQGGQNHRKKDRMFELAEKWRLPIVFFTEGGGGRPGDTDGVGVAGLDCLAFNYFGSLSGLVPLVGIVSGRCFAGNAALLGCCDVVIATRNANIGMGGPAMIEGGGLGVFRPEEVGPASVQYANGVIDVLVDDEAEATTVAKRYLSYFQGTLGEWSCADQRLLRTMIPENRRRIYDVRRVIATIADEGSVLELRRAFGAGMVTSLIRIEGRPLGLIANNPTHLAGAIDSDGADKAARFMQLCDAFDLPIVSLVDTPGIMVGPEVEKTALVRHASRLFVTGSSITVPLFAVILRKAYGLGAQAMAGGSFRAPFFTVSWPTGEFGGMGLEGAVKLGYRNELAAIEDPEQRRALYQEMVERMYAHGKAVNTASHFEIDDVIDPLDTRRWITSALRSLPPAAPRTEKKRPNVDTW
jgi:acetyl/propionyl-CoA carboxylase alpha subunit/acetyl-CoA carboxylase carboxyltransferase component